MKAAESIRLQEMARSRMTTLVDYDPADAAVAKTVVLPHVMHRVFDQPAPTPLEGLQLVHNAMFGSEDAGTAGLREQFESAAKQAKRLAADPETAKGVLKLIQKISELLDKVVTSLAAAKKAEELFHEEIHF